MFPAATATFALGMSDEKDLSGRIARNEAFTHSGNAVFAVAAGIIGSFIAAAIYGVLLTLVTADLSKGTGRFNFLQGVIQSAMGLGAFLSNLAFGAVAKAWGFNAAFLGLSAFAVAGGLLVQFRVPETRNS